MICPKNKCTGCFACYNICPKSAIEMKEDKIGSIMPHIDEKKCIKCNLCKKVCQYYNNEDFHSPQKGFAAIAKDEFTYKTTTSGGIATVISNNIIKQKGVVYGTGLEDGKIKVIRIEKDKDLNKIKGSKYVHSYVENSYRKIKKDLELGLKVLFIGTPCQINGLQLFLRKKYENLYTIDLICHGVPTQKFLYDEKKSKSKRDIPIKFISFRNENGYEIKIEDEFSTRIEKDYNNRYYYAFLNAIIYRENCYDCKYAKNKRCGDITLGDFWGLKTELLFEHKKGVNCVLVNTDKGIELFNDIKHDIYYKETGLEEIIAGNDQLRKPSEKHKKRDLFLKYYLKKGYKSAMKKAVFPDFYIKKTIKNIKNNIKTNKTIYEMYKKIRSFFCKENYNE